jgi:CDP-paratose 2-epimerase
MKVCITGICGFVGATLAKSLATQPWISSICGIDNFSRPGSELNRKPLMELGVGVFHGDIRCASDVESLPKVDWVIDAAANPSVLAGVDGKTSSRQLVEHNLLGTINLLEYCKAQQSGFVLLSTSRVYSIAGLANLRMQVVDGSFAPDPNQEFPAGVSTRGVSEAYSTDPPVSRYGSTKVTSEHLAIEYSSTFGFPVWVNRCGVMAGAGQFGHPAQGIVAYWIHSFREKKPLKYMGFGGDGHQVRDCLHPRDLVPLLKMQFGFQQLDRRGVAKIICNVSGGADNSSSLANLTRWCTDRFGKLEISRASEIRPFDIPWMVLDSTEAKSIWNWAPLTPLVEILAEIADFAETEPNWLDFCASK